MKNYFLCIYRNCRVKQNVDATNKNDEDVERHLRDLAGADVYS